MSSYNTDEYSEIISRFDFALIREIDPADYIDFGIRESKKYADKLFRIMDAQRLTAKEQTMVIILATAVKNRTRILDAMKKFRGKPWFNNVDSFFRNYVYQYTYEEEDHTFSCVHISSSVPFLAARVWLHMTAEEDVTEDNFVHNFWAAQLNLDSRLMEAQRNWEAGFWDNTVLKGGKSFEANKFNSKYWDTKAADKYLLLNADGSPFGSEAQIETTQPYSSADLKKWFDIRNTHEETLRYALSMEMRKRERMNMHTV